MKSGDVKSVGVKVFAFRKAPELPVQLSVSTDFLDLSDLPEREVTVKWTIVTKGFRFPTDGTAIVFTSPGSKQIFNNAVVGCNDEDKGSNRTASVKVQNTSGLAYAYTISVIDEATGLTTSLDPGVQVRSW